MISLSNDNLWWILITKFFKNQIKCFEYDMVILLY